MAIYALLGGRSTSYLNNPILEEKIFKLAKLEKPNILYFPFACLDDMTKSFNKFKELMKNANCKLDCIYSLDNKEEVLCKIKWADVLYFGGGHSEDLIKTIKDSYVNDLLIDTEKVICGISAGAIMLSKSGMGDRYAYSNAYRMYNYKMVDGLSIIPITICPHYNHDGLLCYNDIVSDYNIDGYALEDDTGIVFSEDKVIVIKGDNSKSVYFFSRNDKYKIKPLYEVVK